MLNKDIKTSGHFVLCQNIGISLIFVGVTISMFLNYFYPIMYWTPWIMILSCILLCNKNTFKGTAYLNKSFKIIIYYQLLMLFYLICFFNNDTDQSWTKQLSYHLYILAIISIFARTPSLKERNFLPVLTIISSVLTIITSICHYLDLFELTHRLVQIGDEQRIVLEVFTTNISAFVNFVCCILLFNRKQKLISLFLICLIVVDIYNIIQSGKRSYFVALGSVSILYLYKMKRMLTGIATSSILFVLLFALIPHVQDAVIELTERTVTGFSTLYGDNQSYAIDWDDSASLRVYLRRLAIIKLNKFTDLNLLFGGGYLCQFFDNPLGEAYIDMGIIGFVMYAYIIIIMPLIFFKRINCNHKNELFAFFLALMNICICLTNNDPYTYLAYTPVCLIAMYSYRIDYRRYCHRNQTCHYIPTAR